MSTYFVTKATHKSYICKLVGDKKICMINCTDATAAASGKDHKDVIEHLHQKLLQRNLTKDQLVRLRDEFLAA